MLQPNNIYPQCYVDPVSAYRTFHHNNYEWNNRQPQYTHGYCLKDSILPPYMKPFIQPPPYQYNATRGNKSKDGEKDVTEWDKVENASAAFLGPQLWEKTVPCNSDLKVGESRFEYMDLDEFLNENDLEDEFFKKSLTPGNFFPTPTPRTSPPHDVDKLSPSISPSEMPFENPITAKSPEEPIDNQVKSRASSPDSANRSDFSSPPGSPDFQESGSEDDGADFDPTKRPFSEEELKPQPMSKKSRKQYVPHDLKDDRYWARRRKNNLAAKRSRDARRVKENQIALRAGFLEKENDALREELDKARDIMETLKKKLAKYESSNGIMAEK